MWAKQKPKRGLRVTYLAKDSGQNCSRADGLAWWEVSSRGLGKAHYGHPDPVILGPTEAILSIQIKEAPDSGLELAKRSPSGVGKGCSIRKKWGGLPGGQRRKPLGPA